MYVLRRTAVRSAHEIYDDHGEIVTEFHTDRPISLVRLRGNTVYYVEEISPGRGIVKKTSPGTEPVALSEGGNWTNLVFSPSGDLLAFDSLFLSRDLPPSAVRVHNLSTGAVFFEDQFSYHYPYAGKALWLLSPIDRRIRHMTDRAREIGMINALDAPPILSHDGERLAWFGPDGEKSALYVSDASGRTNVFITPLSELPMTWLGKDLAIAHPSGLTTQWILKRHDVSTGLINHTFIIPNNVIPRKLLGSPTGEFIGLETGYGSMLIRLADGFVEEFFNVPLSDWRFSADGRKLYFVEQERLSLLELK